MNLTPQAQAILLMTVPLGSSDPRGPRPLNDNEWARFAAWLKEHDLQPATLLTADCGAILSGWSDEKITTHRIQQLLARGPALGISLEKWTRAGLWVLTRADHQYPARIKQRLKSKSPPVLFGCGEKALLNSAGIAIVGSRDASDADLSTAEKLGSAAASEGITVISGCARGVDQQAMQGALNANGTAVGVLADSLLRSSTSSHYRKSLMSGNLVLVTPFNPETGFSVANAMARNRHIYCAADAAIVVCSTPDKGGTWNGAVDNLKHGWVPTWVNHSSAADSGNHMLASKGGAWLPKEIFSIASLMDRLDPVRPSVISEETLGEQRPGSPPDPQGAGKRSTSKARSNSAHLPYSSFVARLSILLAKGPLTPADIAAEFSAPKAAMNALLKEAVSAGKVEKLSKPVRYRLSEPARKQVSLFDDQS